MEDSRSKHGMFSWNELLTTDPAAAKEFYTQLFGWTTQAWPMGDFDYTIVMAGEVDVGGIMPIPEMAKGMPPSWGAYVTVDDVDATAAKAEKLGGKVIVAPKEIPSVGRFTVIQDPQGAVISAITYVKK
jgi:predicted enzyme related to lactoylglutathione lyase